MPRSVLIFIVFFPFIQGCVDVTSIFDSGPSDEDLFKQASTVKKLYPPKLTNIKDGDKLKTSVPWEGTCADGSKIEFSSNKISKNKFTIDCKNKKFSQILPLLYSKPEEIVEISVTQQNGPTISAPTIIKVSFDDQIVEVSAKKESTNPIVAVPADNPVKVSENKPKTQEALPEIIKDNNIKNNVIEKPAPPVLEAKKVDEKKEVIKEPIISETIPPAPIKVAQAPEANIEPATKVITIEAKPIEEKFLPNNSKEVLIDLTGAFVVNEIGAGGGKGYLGIKNLIDEQRVAGDPKLNKGNSGFKTAWSEAARLNKDLEFQKPYLGGTIDLGKSYELTDVYIFGGNNVVSFYAGGPVSDWVVLGQVRLKAGSWNKVSFDKKINTRYLRMGIDFLSSDFDGEYTASSGSEIVVYGKPFDERSPAGIPSPMQVIESKTFDDFVGVNLFVNDPIGEEWIYSPDAKGKFRQKFNTTVYGVEGFSHVRLNLFTPWFLTHFDYNSPNWLLRFQSISLEHHRLDMDYFLTELSKQRSIISNKPISISAKFDYTIPSLFPNKIKDYLKLNFKNQKDQDGQTLYPWSLGKVKPLSNTEKINGKVPKDFKDESELYFQYAGRYGKTPSTLLEQNRKLASHEKVVSGLGVMTSIEGYSNPDKSKNAVCPECSFFTPLEYASYLSAIYDGEQKSLGNNYGIKNSDPSTKVIFGSLSVPSIDYPLMVSLWSKENRSSSLPFDVLGFSATSRSQGKASIPEKSGLYETYKKLVEERNRYFPDKEIWITEFGFESNPESNMGVNVGAGFSPDDTQGIWLTRSLLLLNAAGVDRVYLQPLFDNQYYSSTSYGLVQSGQNGYTAKKSYFYVTSLLKLLKDFKFDKIVDQNEENKGTQDVITLKFKHNSNTKRFVYVSWTPTNNGQNHVMSRYIMPTDVKASKAQLLYLNSSGIEPVRSPANIDDQGNIILDVKEIPTGIEVEIP